MQEPTDWELIQRYRQGDQSAFTGLMTRYQRPVYNAALGVLHRSEDARDVTQEVFLKVAERLDDYDPQHKFFSWVYRIALNESLNVRRGSARWSVLGSDLQSTAADANPEREAGDEQVSRRIRSALMRLPESDRTVISLRHFSGCSYAMIGEMLHLEEKVVKSRLFESRQRLRTLLADLE